MLCLLRALKCGGKLSIVSVIGKLSLTVPILFSMVFLGEKLSLLRMIGLGLFVLFVVLLQEPARAEQKEPS